MIQNGTQLKWSVCSGFGWSVCSGFSNYQSGVTWYKNGNPTPIATNIGALSLNGLTESGWYVAKFMQGGCEKITAFNYNIHPDAEALTTTLTCCSGEHLKLKGDGADGYNCSGCNR